jgi:hypothetical protein
MAEKELTVQTSLFDLPDFDQGVYSIKSDNLAQAVLGRNIKTTLKRAFEGVLTKIKDVDIEAFIQEDKPLRIRLSQREYTRMFPYDPKVPDIFEEAALYYTKNTTLEVPQLDNPDKVEYVNVVDKAKVLDDGDLEILFTRSILPHLQDVKARILVLDIKDFSKLRSPYTQKLFEMYSSWKGTAVVTRVSVDALRKVLNTPPSYNTARLRKQIIDKGNDEINEETSLYVTYEMVKGETGKAIKYFDFTVIDKNSQQDDLIEGEYQVIEETDEITDVLVNNFAEQGVSDEIFEAIVELRRQKNKPVLQVSVDAFIRSAMKIARQEETKSLDEILDIIVSQGYVSTLKAEWFLDEIKLAREQAKKELELQNQEAQKNKSIPKADTQTAKSEIKNLRQVVKGKS